MKIIGVVSSPRYGMVSDKQFEKVLASKDIVDTIHEIGYEGNVSNSEALLLAAMWGASQEGADVKLVYPDDKVPNPEEFDGVVLSTPVYFGDRSSTLHKFILTVDLKDKAVGIVSSGAKRNGGQETTNIYALYDCLDRGALITGNGPPTAQYGGTGWAGNKMAIVNDDFGIKTSYGTGKQVARLAHLIGLNTHDETVNILIAKMTEDDVPWYPSFDNANVRILDIFSKKIKKCVGCPVCPNGDLTKEYKCIMQDDMKQIREAMVWADCIIYLTGPSYSKFQLFIERTRFIRRNHFDLGERVYSNMNITNSLTDITALRIMTNMLRQNMFGLPFYKEYRNHHSVNMHILSYIKMIEKYARKSKIRRLLTGIDVEYTAVGYEDAKLDEKAYRD